MTSTSPHLGSDAVVRFAGNGIRVLTALLDVWQDVSEVHVAALGGGGEAVLLAATREMRTRTGGRETVARIGGGTARAAITGDVDVLVTSAGHAEVRGGATTFALAPDAGRTVISGVAGRAEVAATGFAVWCAESGWRITASASLVVLEPVGGACLVWDRRTGHLEAAVCPHVTLSTRDSSVPGPCAACGAGVDARWDGAVLEIDLAGTLVRWEDGVLTAGSAAFEVTGEEHVRVRWDGKDLVLKDDLARAGAVDEDWFVTADGRVLTGGSSVSAARSLDGTLEVTVTSLDDEGTALVWADGVRVEGGGLRVALDAEGRMVCTTVARADHSVTVPADGAVTIAVGTTTVELGRADAALGAR
ncbi:hypothetical protein [Lentzea sp. CA-135723]|uniref:hypothetical protein n=1 Tax=Lentzea sp. CA-135723 TaxID=3239950 RepID=UPI003D8B3E1B